MDLWLKTQKIERKVIAEHVLTLVEVIGGFLIGCFFMSFPRFTAYIVEFFLVIYVIRRLYKAIATHKKNPS